MRDEASMLWRDPEMGGAAVGKELPAVWTANKALVTVLLLSAAEREQRVRGLVMGDCCPVGAGVRRLALK